MTPNVYWISMRNLPGMVVVDRDHYPLTYVVDKIMALGRVEAVTRIPWHHSLEESNGPTGD